MKVLISASFISFMVSLVFGFILFSNKINEKNIISFSISWSHRSISFSVISLNANAIIQSPLKVSYCKITSKSSGILSFRHLFFIYKGDPLDNKKNFFL